MSRIGILGGMFDPIHRGHVDVGCAAESALELSTVFVVPANIPPHRPQPFASSFHRFAMVAASVAFQPRWLASDIEVRAAEPSYTSATLREFQKLGYRAGEIFFITGADAFVEIESWKDYPDLLALAHFVVVSRPGSPVSGVPERLPSLSSRMSKLPVPPEALANPMIILIDAQTADVSSTAVRGRAARGESIAGMVDASVQQHIERHGLYRNASQPEVASDDAPQTAAGRLHAPSREPRG